MFDTAVSGINSAMSRMAVSAHNIANVNTAGYTRRGRGSGAGQDNANLTLDILEQTTASYAVKANAIVIRTANEIQGQMLDIIA